MELYNILADPREEINLAEKEKRRVDAMLPKLDAFYDPNNPSQ